MPTVDSEFFLRQDLLDFPPYVASSVATTDFDRVIKLNSNENPFGPSPKALAALADMRHWERYATQDELRPEIGYYLGLDPAHVIVGNGSDEMIDLVQRMVLDRGDAIVDCTPSFEMYEVYARLNGARIIQVPRREDFSVDVDAVEKAVAREQPKMIFIANPSNPDGGIAALDEIERLLALPTLIVLDEAYAEFSGESYVARVPIQSNLIVLRTFSKWAGLAGLRVGFAVAPIRIADQMMRTKSPYSINSAAIVATRASLDDLPYLMANVQRIIAERERLSAALAQFKFLQPLPSHTNFVLCRVVGRNALELRNALRERSILIRAYTSPRLREYVRISAGTPEQDDALLRALEEIGRG